MRIILLIIYTECLLCGIEHGADITAYVTVPVRAEIQLSTTSSRFRISKNDFSNTPLFLSTFDITVYNNSSESQILSISGIETNGGYAFMDSNNDRVTEFFLMLNETNGTSVFDILRTKSPNVYFSESITIDVFLHITETPKSGSYRCEMDFMWTSV